MREGQQYKGEGQQYKGEGQQYKGEGQKYKGEGQNTRGGAKIQRGGATIQGEEVMVLRAKCIKQLDNAVDSDGQVSWARAEVCGEKLAYRLEL